MYAQHALSGPLPELNSRLQGLPGFQGFGDNACLVSHLLRGLLKEWDGLEERHVLHVRSLEFLRSYMESTRYRSTSMIQDIIKWFWNLVHGGSDLYPTSSCPIIVRTIVVRRQDNNSCSGSFHGFTEVTLHEQLSSLPLSMRIVVWLVCIQDEQGASSSSSSSSSSCSSCSSCSSSSSSSSSSFDVKYYFQTYFQDESKMNNEFEI